MKFIPYVYYYIISILENSVILNSIVIIHAADYNGNAICKFFFRLSVLHDAKRARNHYSNTYAGRKSLSEIIHLLPFW